MHAVVMDSLEEYLSGTLEPATQREIEAHVKTCDSCREEIRSMQELSQCLTSLRFNEVFSPSPGFYARVMQEADGQRAAARSVTGWLSFDFAFARRLAFASLLTLAILGGYLVSRETGYTAGPSPEAVMAEQELPIFDSASAPDNMLVTLTAYEH